MKKNHLTIAGLIFIAGLTACGNNSGSTTSTSESTSKKTDTNTAGTTSADNNNTTSTTTSTGSKMPLGKEDSMFVMKAAMGGMMEVEGGKIAQQNAQNDRVKNFGSMMVNDHTAANNELMTLASSKGMTIPTTLPKDMQAHLDAMKKMQGKAFDSHYMSMMLSDHKEDVGEFEKASTKCKDPELKSWVNKTLPTLKTHLDSAQAISKAKM